jgi:hypothetical protein
MRTGNGKIGKQGWALIQCSERRGMTERRDNER